jgi:hypothetical protein
MPVDVYQSLGVRGVINAAATLTSMGGCTLPDDIVDAMASASSSYVDIRELHEKAGEAIASLTNNEAAYQAISRHWLVRQVEVVHSRRAHYDGTPGTEGGDCYVEGDQAEGDHFCDTTTLPVLASYGWTSARREFMRGPHAVIFLQATLCKEQVRRAKIHLRSIRLSASVGKRLISMKRTRRRGSPLGRRRSALLGLCVLAAQPIEELLSCTFGLEHVKGRVLRVPRNRLVFALGL